MKCIKCNNDITNHKEINGKNYCINCSIKKYKKMLYTLLRRDG